MHVKTTMFLFLGLMMQASGESPVLRGTVRFERPLETPAPVRVWAMKRQPLAEGGFAPLSKPDIFAAAAGGAEFAVADDEGHYELELADGDYSLFAFADLSNDGSWNPGGPEPFGWYASEPAGTYEALRPTPRNGARFDLTLRAPRPFPKSTQTAPGGALTTVNGYPVLQLAGDAKTRGFAHGKLVADQIVDFFRFYVLESQFQSARAYEEGFAKFLLSHFHYPETFVTECEAVLDGMRASGCDLSILELAREFSLVDLYAINGYIETRAMASSCTQFAAWGGRTRGTDVDGGMITGRNMDGEIDLRKVTVSHFLIFAIDPAEEGHKRYVSMMWPGFVATISGMNEEGFYTMENAGLTGPGPVVGKLVPFAWTMREALARLGADATHQDVQALVDSFDNAAGGSNGPGCITLFAVPFTGQTHPAFVMEGDRFGEEIRFAGEAWPAIPEALVLSNHPRKYGVSAEAPAQVFDKTPSFSSLWRYQAGASKLDAWHRQGRAIGTAEMRELLQTVAHGTTEYAVIARPNRREFDLAVASLQSEPWDAPYRKWTTFKFHDVFPPPPASLRLSRPAGTRPLWTARSPPAALFTGRDLRGGKTK